MENSFVNKVAESGIVTIDLETYYPQQEIVLFDLQPFLFMGLILKEKEYREALKQTDFYAYNDKLVAVTCTADAIIPMWAYMLAATYLQPNAQDVFFGTIESVKEKILLKNLETIAVNDFEDKRVVIKGCGEMPIGESAYLTITKMLRPVAKSIMYGEPCSTVPIFKRK